MDSRALLTPPRSSEVVAPHPRLIRPGQGSLLNKSGDQSIPFVVDFSMLEEAEKELSTEEAAAVALALFELCPKPSSPASPWEISAGLTAISNRL